MVSLYYSRGFDFCEGEALHSFICERASLRTPSAPSVFPRKILFGLSSFLVHAHRADVPAVPVTENVVFPVIEIIFAFQVPVKRKSLLFRFLQGYHSYHLPNIYLLIIHPQRISATGPLIYENFPRKNSLCLGFVIKSI